MEQILTLGILGGLLVALVKEIAPAALLMFSSVLCFFLLGVIDEREAFSGFSSPVVFSIAALLILAAAIDKTKALSTISSLFFGKSHHLSAALGRILGLSGLSSIFLNNTTIVTILTPSLLRWCRRQSFSSSHFLMPLSFITIVGGMCSLIGTTTNLLIHGLMLDVGMEGLGMFELASFGIPALVVALLYLSFQAPRVLPSQSDLSLQVEHEQNRYIRHALVSEDSPLVGKTVEGAGLRHLDGLFLVSIEREERLINAVRPEEVIYAGDRLAFAGRVETITQIHQLPGVVPAYQEEPRASKPGKQSQRYEVVISSNSSLVGQTLRDISFRSRYHAVVLAVHRADSQINKKLGDIILKPGDILLVEGSKQFLKNWQYSNDFLLIAQTRVEAEPSSQQAYYAFGILASLIVAVTIFHVALLPASLVAALATILSGCLRLYEAKAVISKNLDPLILIASAFGIGHAIQSSGLSSEISSFFIETLQMVSPTSEGFNALQLSLILGALLLLTSLLTEVVTNQAAAAIMFPIAIELSQQLLVSSRPFIIAIAIGASLCLLTPFGYQTNLLVYSTGNYKFSDYLRLGAPLKLILLVMAAVSIPWIWRF